MKRHRNMRLFGKLVSARRVLRGKSFRSTGNRLRRGMLIHETTTAILIVMLVVAGASQMLHLVSRQRRVAAQRATATLEVANLMEELASRSWPEITEQSPKLDISQASRARLPQAKLQLDIVADETDSDARRIAIAIDWQLDDLHRSSPVRLVTWQYPPREMKP